MYKIIFINGTEPTSITEENLFVFDIENKNVVEKSSGIPNVSLKKIYGNIMAGDVFEFDKLRIECIETNGISNAKNAYASPMSYKLLSSNGEMEERPIYPIISTIQQVESVVDVSLNDMLLNIDSLFKISTLPPNTKMKYSFYPTKIRTATGDMIKTDNNKEMSIPNLNSIDFENVSYTEKDGIGAENVSEEVLEGDKLNESKQYNQSNESEVSAESIGNESKKKSSKKCFWWIIALAVGTFATIKAIRNN